MESDPNRRFDLNELDGATVRDTEGQTIGTVVDVYVDVESDQPEWLLVDLDPSGGEVLVPLLRADQQKQVVTVPYTGDEVRNAPPVDESEELSADDEHRLLDYYEPGRGHVAA